MIFFNSTNAIWNGKGLRNMPIHGDKEGQTFDGMFQNISVFQGLLDEDRIKLIYEYTPLPK